MQQNVCFCKWIDTLYKISNEQRRRAVHAAAAQNNSQTKLPIFSKLALSLFVFRVFTDYSDTTFSFDNFAFFANRFNR
jgi:hypothetical protein